MNRHVTPLTQWIVAGNGLRGRASCRSTDASLMAFDVRSHTTDEILTSPEASKLRAMNPPLNSPLQQF